MSDEPRRSWITFLLKSRLGRMTLLAGALAGILATLPALWQRRGKGEPKPDPGAPESASGTLPPRPTGFEESLPVASQFKALVASYGDRVTGTEKELQATRKELETLRIQLEDARTRARKDAEAAPPRMASPKDGPGPDPKGVPSSGALPPFAPRPADERPPEKEGVRLIELSAPPPEPKPVQKWLRIPPATGGQATLLNGVFAPVQGEPAPVRLRLEAALVGPNRSRIPLRNAMVIGKALGDANSSRVSIQIDRLATVKENGESVEAKVLGYVVGEDGREGVPGTYEWRAWELVPLALASGALQGGTDALAQNQTTTQISPLGGATTFVTGDALKMAGFRGASGASGKMGEIVGERMREIRPAVSTPAGRRVQVIFLDGVTLEGLGVQEVNLERDWDPYRGLDLHR